MSVKFIPGVSAVPATPAKKASLRLLSSRFPHNTERSIYGLRVEPVDSNEVRLTMKAKAAPGGLTDAPASVLHVLRQDILDLADAIRRGEI